LGKARTARCAVPLEIPKWSQIRAHDCPCLRRLAILGRSTVTRGLPSSLPRGFARARPEGLCHESALVCLSLDPLLASGFSDQKRTCNLRIYYLCFALHSSLA